MDILACPHCSRQFHAPSGVFGKKIRCRGCRQMFYVPHDTSSVPLGPPAAPAGRPPAPVQPPLARASVVDGRDARSCPDCGRTFLMQPAFAGKVIRCRACRFSFRVAATPGPAARPAPPVPGATLFDDIGEVLDGLAPGEQVASVVRPRGLSNRGNSAALAGLATVVLGTVCALPITQLLLWWVFGRDPVRLAPRLPEALEWLAPAALVSPPAPAPAPNAGGGRDAPA